MNSNEKEIINIYPQNTSIEHSEDIDCWCEPEVKELENYIKVYHHTVWEVTREKIRRENQ